MLRSSALATTKRSPPTKMPSAKALSLAAASPPTMLAMTFISSGLICIREPLSATCRGESFCAPGAASSPCPEPGEGEEAGPESMVKRGGGGHTSKPDEVAQTLSPATLMMAALSMWPVATRLQVQVSARVLFAAMCCSHRPSAIFSLIYPSVSSHRPLRFSRVWCLHTSCRRKLLDRGQHVSQSCQKVGEGGVRPGGLPCQDMVRRCGRETG